MQNTNAPIQMLIDTIEQQERDLVFQSFGIADGWEIGLMLREYLLKCEANAIIDITVNSLQIFRCAVGHPTPHNDTWITRKRNTVMEYWKSSLRVTQELLLSGKTLEDCGLSAERYALSGGGFPICVRNLGVVGTVIVSGLPHKQDHQAIVYVFSEYLNTTTASVPG